MNRLDDGLRRDASSQGHDDRLRKIVLSEMLHHDLEAKQYDDVLTEPWCVRFYYHDLVANTLRGTASAAPFVLDLCCGTGKGSLALASSGIPVLGIDISRNMLSIYAQTIQLLGLDNVLLVQADATCPPVRAESVGYVQMIGGLHHIPDRRRCVEYVYGILQPQGLMVLHEPLIPEPLPRIRLFSLFHYPLVLTDIPRVWRAILRRVGLARRSGSQIADLVTPWEQGLRLTEVRQLMEENAARVLVLRGSGLFACLQLPPWVGESAASRVYNGLLVPIDRRLSEHQHLDRQGSAFFLVAQKS